MKKNRRIISIAAAIAAFAGLIVACTFTVESITLPETIKAGETVEFSANLSLTHVQSDQTSSLLVGVLVPKAWNAAANMTATVSTTGRPSAQGPDIVNAPMHVVDASEVEPQTKLSWSSAFQSAYGSCGNYGLLEWVVLKTDEQYVIGWSENYTWYANVTVKMKAPASNDSHFLAVAFCGSTDGFGSDDNGNRYSNALTAQFNVTGGEGRNDYTCPPTVSTTPLTFSYEDIFSINFVSKIGDKQNDLYGVEKVYLMAKCTLKSGKIASVSTKTKANLMKKTSDIDYHKYIYPRSFFGITENDEIVDMQVWFEDESGSKKVDNDTYNFPISQNATLLK